MHGSCFLFLKFGYFEKKKIFIFLCINKLLEKKYFQDFNS